MLLPSLNIPLAMFCQVSLACTVFFALITLFSPLYGFLADVRCGRYGVLLAAIWLAFCAFILVSVGAIITLRIGINAWDTNYAHGYVAPILLSLAAIGFVLFAVGLGFYRANFVQFGLDQLLEAPSKSLALFIHWGVWVERLGMLVIQTFLLVLLCQVKSQPNYVPFCAILLVLMIVLVILCFRRKWFYVEPGQNNPLEVCFIMSNNPSTQLGVVPSLTREMSRQEWTLLRRGTEDLSPQSKLKMSRHSSDFVCLVSSWSRNCT